jgi:hypothetical protein
MSVLVGFQECVARASQFELSMEKSWDMGGERYSTYQGEVNEIVHGTSLD